MREPKHRRYGEGKLQVVYLGRQACEEREVSMREGCRALTVLLDQALANGRIATR